MIKKIIIPLLLLAVIGAGVGFYMYNKPVTKMAQMKVDEAVSAEQLFTAYEADEAAANAKYLDKVVEVKGKVVKSNKDEEKTTIMLDTGDMLANIMCQMEDKTIELPKEGTTVTVKGLCSGYLTDVVLIRGILK